MSVRSLIPPLVDPVRTMGLAVLRTLRHSTSLCPKTVGTTGNFVQGVNLCPLSVVNLKPIEATWESISTADSWIRNTDLVCPPHAESRGAGLPCKVFRLFFCHGCCTSNVWGKTGSTPVTRCNFVICCNYKTASDVSQWEIEGIQE